MAAPLRAVVKLTCLFAALSCGVVVPVFAQPVPARAQLEALRFMSDHQLLRRNTSNILTGGERYPAVSWQRSPAANAPITHTAGAGVRLKAVLTATLSNVPEGTPYLLVGRSVEPALCFRQEGMTGDNKLEAVLEAEKPLGKAVRKIRQPIRWTLSLQPETAGRQVFDLGSTGPHTVYTTLGTPKVTDDPRTQVTDMRMELVVQRLASAQAKQGLDASVPWLVYELMKQNGDAYLPTRHYGRELAWRVPESSTLEPRGASCISIVEFVGLLCKLGGLEGEFSTVAFYAKADEPRKALLGLGLGDPPITKKAPNNENWQLFLVDDTNTEKGQVGGLGGMNFYEATLQVEWRGRKFFYPGGTDRVYADPEKVLMVFRTLAWAAYDFQIGHWVVREVVHTYSRPGEKQSASVPLP